MEEAIIEQRELTRESLERILFEMIQDRLLEEHPEEKAREIVNAWESKLPEINSYLSRLKTQYARLSPNHHNKGIAEKDLATYLVHQYLFKYQS